MKRICAGRDHFREGPVADGTSIPASLVVWAGGLEAASLSSHASRVLVMEDRLMLIPTTPYRFTQVYAIGDFANIKAADGAFLPQLGSVALQPVGITRRTIFKLLRDALRL